MSTRLPLVPQTAAAASRLCVYCPKMCRFSCPVSEATRSETVTPWGKMTMLALTAAAGRAPTVPEEAEALYACSGCLRCQTYCTHENDVPAALYAGRAAAVRAGVAPAAAVSVGAAFRARGSLEAIDLQSAATRWTGPRKRGGVLFAGCEALAREPHTIDAMLSATKALGVPLSVHTAAPLCCGRPLLEAGFAEAFAARAERVATSLRTHAGGRAGRVVVLEPRCAETMVRHYASVGVELALTVNTATTFLAQHLPAAPDRSPFPGHAVYHDACALARGLAETEAPRELLKAAFAGGVHAPEGSDVLCCGAGGLMPRTLPLVAAGMARRLAQTLPAGADDMVVSASGACRRHLADVGTSVVDLVAVVSRWLAGGNKGVMHG